MVNQAHGRRITAVLRLNGNRRVVLRMAGTALGCALFTVGGAWLLWLGYHPDGSGRPPAWNIFAGYCGLVVGVPSVPIVSLFTLQELGLVPALVAVRVRRGFRVGSPLSLLTARAFLISPGETSASLEFPTDPLVVPGRSGYLAYRYILKVKGGPRRTYIARSPIDARVRADARAVLRDLGTGRDDAG